jgi:hypothetical protein
MLPNPPPPPDYTPRAVYIGSSGHAFTTSLPLNLRLNTGFPLKTLDSHKAILTSGPYHIYYVTKVSEYTTIPPTPRFTRTLTGRLASQSRSRIPEGGVGYRLESKHRGHQKFTPFIHPGMPRGDRVRGRLHNPQWCEGRRHRLLPSVISGGPR